MDLDLVDGGHDLGLLEQPLQMVVFEVGYADGAGSTLGVDALECLPSLDEVVHRGQGPVDEEQVDPIHVQGDECLVEGTQGIIEGVLVVIELAGHEDLGPVDARSGNSLSYLFLVAVHLRRVEVPVADLQCGGHRFDRVSRSDLEHAEAELGGMSTPLLSLTLGTAVAIWPLPSIELGYWHRVGSRREPRARVGMT